MELLQSVTQVLIALFTGASAVFLAMTRWPSLDVTDWSVRREEGDSRWIVGYSVVSPVPARVARIRPRARAVLDEEWSELWNSDPNAAVGPTRSYRARHRLQSAIGSHCFDAEDTYVYVEVRLYWRFLWFTRSARFLAGVTIREGEDGEKASIVRLSGDGGSPASWENW